jgi:hypothetical protein
MNSVIYPLHNGNDHAIIVALSASEVCRISQALDENPEEWDNEGKPSNLNRKFDELFWLLEDEGYAAREHERNRSLPFEQEPW